MSINFNEYQNIQQRLLNGGRLIFPNVFFEELSYMEQIVVLWKTKQNLLKAGENISLHENEDGTVTISANDSGEEESYRIEEVAPTSGNSRAYALINAETGQQSGTTIQIPMAIKGDKGDKGDTGNGIEQITLSEELPTGNKYRFDMTNGSFYYVTMPRGPQGIQGESGVDGFSPMAEVTQTSDGATVTITDENGTTTANISNGVNGSDGVSPSASVTQTASGATVTITDENGTTTADISNGVDGSDGFSPLANVTQTSGGATITITDENGTTTANISNGVDGQQGPAGNDGVTPDVAMNVSVGSNTGTPTVNVTKSGTTAQPVFTVVFDGLKGEQGLPGSGADGVGISNIAFKESTQAGNTYTITLSNGQAYDFTAPIGPQGSQGVPGGQGAPGIQGNPGNDGFSPIAVVTQLPQGGASIAITDVNGTTYANIRDGIDGTDGVNGFSPIANVTQFIGGATIQIIDQNGSTIATVNDGSDGFSPIATATRTGNTVVISITDANGTTSGTVYDGVSPTIAVTQITGGHHIQIVTAAGTENFDVMDGTDGSDGISPTVTVSQQVGYHHITITSAGGTEQFDVYDGADGVGISSITYNSQDAQGGNVYDVNLTSGSSYQIVCPKGATGSQGPAGQGIPAITAGDAGKILAVNSNEDGTEWISGSGGSGLPAIVAGDAGKILAVNSNEDGAEWIASSNALPSYQNTSTYHGRILTIGTNGALSWDAPIKTGGVELSVDKLTQIGANVEGYNPRWGMWEPITINTTNLKLENAYFSYFYGKNFLYPYIDKKGTATSSGIIGYSNTYTKMKIKIPKASLPVIAQGATTRMTTKDFYYYNNAFYPCIINFEYTSSMTSFEITMECSYPDGSYLCNVYPKIS